MTMLRLLFALITLTAAAALASSAAADEITPENVLRLMNERRAAHGLAPLRHEERLRLAASDRMRHMEESEFWSHTSPDGISPFVWLAARAYKHQYASENLARGFETATLLVDAWMESPGHRANILSPMAEDCGIAVIEGSTTGPAPGRSIVILFGRAQPFMITRSSSAGR